MRYTYCGSSWLGPVRVTSSLRECILVFIVLLLALLHSLQLLDFDAAESIFWLYLIVEAANRVKIEIDMLIGQA